MFYVYVLRSSKTGPRYVGSCENIDERIRRHNLGHSKATATVFHGLSWTARSLRVVQKQRGKSGSIKRAEVAMNSTGLLDSAVAAATGRGYPASPSVLIIGQVTKVSTE
jgi:predicted GIY-YIG superfamily endonuclease